MSMNERPAALDGLLGFITEALPDEDDAHARAAIAPLEEAVRAAKDQERSEIRDAARAEAAAQLRTDAGLRDAEGESTLAAYGRELADLIAPNEAPGIVRLADQAQGVEPNPPARLHAHPGITRVPISRSVRYAVRGAPEVQDEYNATRTIAPTEITLTYRDAPDSGLGRVHAYVKGWWMQDGARVHSEAVGRHFHGGREFAHWPEWLTAEARLHDTERPS